MAQAGFNRLEIRPAHTADAPGLAALHTAVAVDLTTRYGRGPWSRGTTVRGVLYSLRTSRVFVAWKGDEMVGTLRLTTKKPWAIDTRYFKTCSRPLYLLGMAVAPAEQRRGIGKRCLEEARRIAVAWPADAIRLDAYDSPAGAGMFYARNGWTEAGRARYRNVPLVYYEMFVRQ